MKRQGFSLVELLTVIGIITLLAGLMIPAVINSKKQGMITQAKADMNAIKMALLGVERDCKTIFKLDSNGNVAGGDIAADAVSKSLKPKGSSNFQDMKVVTYDGSSDTNKTKYNALIMELSVPKEVTGSDKNFNVRNIKYLDPRPDYAPDDPETLWRDPWGNPYVIKVDTAYTGIVFIPIDSAKVLKTPANVDTDGKNLLVRSKVAVYSCGPNGEDDGSFNMDNGGASGTDDVRGWEK